MTLRSKRTTAPGPDVELTLAARPASVAVVRQVLGGVGAALAVDAELLADMRLAVSEACTNAIVHGYRDREPGLLAVEIHREAAHLLVCVRDHGHGISPRCDAPGLGVGLPLIVSLTHSLELSTPPGGGTEVRMTFDLHAREHADIRGPHEARSEWGTG